MELMNTVMLHTLDDTEWTEEELSPVSKIEILDVTPFGAPLGANLTLNNGNTYLVDFVNIDGKRTC